MSVIGYRGDIIGHDGDEPIYGMDCQGCDTCDKTGCPSIEWPVEKVGGGFVWPVRRVSDPVAGDAWVCEECSESE